MTMFTALAGLTARASLHIMIAAEGDQLRVTVQPKPTGKEGNIPPALSISGTPAELDADFAAAVTEYRTPAMSVLEQARAQAKAIADKPATKALPAPAKSSAPKPVKKAAKKPAPPAKKATKPAPAKKAAKPAAKERAPRKDALPREELIAMMRAYLEGLGDGKPARNEFVKQHPKGRRYERLFKSFNEFVDAARQQELPGVTGTITEVSAAQPIDPNGPRAVSVVVDDRDENPDPPAAAAANSTEGEQDLPPVSIL